MSAAHNGHPMTGTSQNRGRGRAPVVGVDAGGTWVRVLATCDGRTVLRTTAPAKSISDLGAFLRTTLAPLGRPSSILIA